MRIALLGFSLILVMYVVVFWTTSLLAINNQESEEQEEMVGIYLSTNGVHTDFVVPMVNEYADWQNLLGLNKVQGTWGAIGWGDKGFYLDTPEWKDLKFKTAFQAISGRGTTALHITQIAKPREDEDCVRVVVSAQEYQLLVHYIQNSFLLDENNKGILIEASGYGFNDYFYEAKGSYSPFYTCNSWVNEGLKSANLKAAFWTFTDTGILRHYR